MRNRVENVSIFLFFAGAAFMMIKLITFIIGVFGKIGIDTTAIANLT